MYYETRGVPGTRQFIVQYTNVIFAGSDTENTFQIILNEGSNDIVVNYIDVTTRLKDGEQRTFGGIENEDGTIGLQYDLLDEKGDYQNKSVRYFPGVETPAPGKGVLKVNLFPEEAVEAGAQWRLSDQRWQDSGASINDLEPGEYTLEFQDISGWETPANLSVNIEADEITTKEVTYIRATSEDEADGLKVFIYPEEAVNAGAKWRVDEGQWNDSGVIVRGLSIGEHTVSFNTIDGWDAPDEITVSLTRQLPMAPGIYTLPEEDNLEQTTYTPNDTTITKNSLVFPHVRSDSTWETEIGVINISDTQELNGSFKLYNKYGVMVSGLDAVVISPLGRKEVTVGFDFLYPYDACYIVFEGDHEHLAGYMRHYADGNYSVATPGVLASGVSPGDIFISHIASQGTWQTFISLVNINTEPVSLNIEFNNGTSGQIDMDPGAYRYFAVSDLFDGQVQPDITSAVIKNVSGVIGMELFLDNSSKLVSGVLIDNHTADRLYFPHIAFSEGWGTGIVVYNPSETAAQLTVLSYDAEGSILDSSNITIHSNKRYAGTIDDLGLPQLTEWIHIQSTQQMMGFELFTNTNKMAGCNGVNNSHQNGIFPKLEKNGASGIAFVNPETDPANVTLTAYNNAGEPVAEKSLTIEPKNKLVMFAHDIFSQNLKNATYIRYTSDRQIVGFQLNAADGEGMLDGLSALDISE